MHSLNMRGWHPAALSMDTVTCCKWAVVQGCAGNLGRDQGKRKERVRWPVLPEVVTHGHRTMPFGSQQLCRGFDNWIWPESSSLLMLTHRVLLFSQPGMRILIWACEWPQFFESCWRWDVALDGAETGMLHELPSNCSLLPLLAIYRSKWWFLWLDSKTGSALMWHLTCFSGFIIHHLMQWDIPSRVGDTAGSLCVQTCTQYCSHWKQRDCDLAIMGCSIFVCSTSYCWSFLKSTPASPRLCF